jgi:putative peptide zinc metalloprotease protein
VARQSKIQLLVRTEGEQAFELRQLPSALAYLQHRPQRLPESQYELARMSSRGDGRLTYVLKNRANERYLLLSEPEHFLWERMDGRTSLQDLATAYVLRYGAFDFDLIPTLIAKLRRVDLLTLRPASRLREVLARYRRNTAARALEATLRGMEHLTLSSRDVQGLFERVYRWGGRLLFTPFCLVAGLVLAVAAASAGVKLYHQAGAVLAPLADNPIVALIMVKLLLFATMAVHQVVHGLACVHYGRKVREYGFTFLHGFVPSFFVDVTDIFLATRRARLVTALSGALTHVYLAGLCLWAAMQMSQGLPQAFIALSGILQLQALFVSLYPFCFIEMDGYHIVADLLGMPTLKSDSWQFVRHEFFRALWRPWTLRRQEAIWAGYFALSLLSICAFVFFNIAALMQAGKGS